MRRLNLHANLSFLQGIMTPRRYSVYHGCLAPIPARAFPLLFVHTARLRADGLYDTQQDDS